MRAIGATTSHGGPSGDDAERENHAGKLAGATPKFIAGSDAAMVAPLIFNRALGK